MFSMIYWFILNNTLKQTKYLYIILYIIVTFILIYKILHTMYTQGIFFNVFWGKNANFNIAVY